MDLPCKEIQAMTEECFNLLTDDVFIPIGHKEPLESRNTYLVDITPPCFIPNYEVNFMSSHGEIDILSWVEDGIDHEYDESEMGNMNPTEKQELRRKKLGNNCDSVIQDIQNLKQT